MVPTPFPLGNVFRFVCLFPNGTYSVAGEGFFSLFPSGTTALAAVMATIAVDLKGKYFCVSSSRIRYLKVFHS